MLKILLVIISDAEIGGSSYLSQSAVNIVTFNTSRPRFCQPSSVAYVCCQGRPMCAWTCYDDGEHTHFLLTSSCLLHLLHMMQLHTDRSLPPSLPRRHSVVAECWAPGASTCSRGTVGIPSQQAGCPDSNNSDEQAHVLHEVCALRLLCISFNTSITNFCPFVSQRPHLLRSFCSSGMFFYEGKSGIFDCVCISYEKVKSGWKLCTMGHTVAVTGLPMGDSKGPVSLDNHTGLLCFLDTPPYEAPGVHEMIRSSISH